MDVMAGWVHEVHSSASGLRGCCKGLIMRRTLVLILAVGALVSQSLGLAGFMVLRVEDFG